MKVVKDIKGQRGSWQAHVTYTDGTEEELACVHKQLAAAWPLYNDPWTPELRITGRFAKHVELIDSKRRVVLTDDLVDESKNRGEGYFERSNTITVYDISDFALDDAGMRFRFVRRYPYPNRPRRARSPRRAA
jgi:hypothetical protein